MVPLTPEAVRAMVIHQQLKFSEVWCAMWVAVLTPPLSFLTRRSLLVMPAADGASGDVARRLLDTIAGVCGCEKDPELSC